MGNKAFLYESMAPTVIVFRLAWWLHFKILPSLVRKGDANIASLHIFLSIPEEFCVF